MSDKIKSLAEVHIITSTWFFSSCTHKCDLEVLVFSVQKCILSKKSKLESEDGTHKKITIFSVNDSFQHF